MQTLDLIGLVALIMIGLNALSLVCTATLRVRNARRTRWLEGKVEIFEPALYDFLNTGKVSPRLKDARGRECEVLSTLISKLISALPDEQDHRKLANLAEDLGLIRRDLNQLHSKKIRVRARAAENLGFYGGPDVVGDLSRLLSEDHETPRALAARALSRIATPEAANALGMMGKETTIPDLKKLMTDSEWWVRTNAGSALSKMGVAGERALVEMLDSPDAYARERAAASLENGGAVRRAVNGLTESGERGEWAQTLIRRITHTEVSKHLRYLEETLSDDEKRDALKDAMSGGHDS
ncbi:hypothetical protein BH24ACT21_BH24ACT21_10660 [soil metagenome]